jgi:hypothetical protein
MAMVPEWNGFPFRIVGAVEGERRLNTMVGKLILRCAGTT